MLCATEYSVHILHAVLARPSAPIASFHPHPTPTPYYSIATAKAIGILIPALPLIIYIQAAGTPDFLSLTYIIHMLPYHP